jgi:hypothetical protein
MAFLEYTLPEKGWMQQTGQIEDYGTADTSGTGAIAPLDQRSFTDPGVVIVLVDAAREKPY